VCPSVYETPGLVNLEAAAMGCSLAIGDCPPVHEYFGDRVVYFDSRNVRAVRRAVEAALALPPPPALAEEILTRYTWQIAARVTVAAYRQVLSQCAANPRGL
jgi:glycosyltransferase involved in cell wall biosynthesis